ncbi:MAG: LppM family (lipo)protein [Bacillota bacterium]
MLGLSKAVLLFLGLIALAGCAYGKFHVTINRNKSADLDYLMTVDSSVFSISGDFFGEMKASAIKEGFDVTGYKKGGMIGFRARKHIKDLRALPDFKESIIRFKRGKKALFVKKGIFSDAYLFNTNIDLSYALGKGESGPDRAIRSHIHLQFLLTMPGKIGKNNADVVEEGTRTLIWNLAHGRENGIQAEASVPNITNIIVIALLLIFLGWYLVNSILTMRRRAGFRNN